MATSKLKTSARDLAATPDLKAVPESTKPSRVSLPCRQASFFQFCRLAWGYCREYITDFAAESPRFDTAYIDSQLALVASVEAMPALKTRKAYATMARNGLMTQSQDLKMLAQKLKTYIVFAYPDRKTRRTALKEAGLNNYSKMGDKWASVAKMAQTATAFMATNLDLLTANNNMPADFPATFALAHSSFQSTWDNFIAKEKAVTDGTGTLDGGLQQLLDPMLPMLEVGRRIFVFQPVARKKFTVKYLRNEVQGKHPAGVKGTVRASGPGEKLPGVTVSALLDGQAKSAVTDAAGRYTLKLPAGTYDISFTSPSTLPFTEPGREVSPGVMGRLNADLQPVGARSATVVRPIVPQPSTESLLREAINEVEVMDNGKVGVDG